MSAWVNWLLGFSNPHQSDFADLKHILETADTEANEQEKQKVKVKQVLTKKYSEVLFIQIKMWIKSCQWDMNSPVSPAFAFNKSALEAKFDIGLEKSPRQQEAQPVIEFERIDDKKDRVYFLIDDNEFYVSYKVKDESIQITQSTDSALTNIAMEFTVHLPSEDKKGAKSDQSISSEDQIVMSTFVKDMNDFLAKQREQTISMLLSTATEVYKQNKQLEEEIVKMDEEKTKQFYKRAWSKEIGGEDAVNSQLPATMEARKHIMRQLSKLMRMGKEKCEKEGFSVRPIVDNPFIWEVKLFNFGEETLLHNDLKQHAEKFETNNMNVVLELRFTSMFPEQPPVIRVIRPRFEYLTGNITSSGLPCIDDISQWTSLKGTDMQNVLLTIRQSLIDNGARVDMRTASVYDAHMASRAFTRMQRSLSMDFPTKNNFEESYVAYSSAYAKRCFGVHCDIEEGNRVLLPATAADQIFSNEDFTLPLMFEIKTKLDHRVFCGVSEFTAPDGNLILPEWLMKSLFIKEGTQVNIRCVNLERGTFAKLQPHSKNFYKLKNHKSVLENVLRKFTTLTEGTSIPIYYGKQVHMVEILELTPNSAVSIVAEPYLDLQIDFAAAIDYEESENLVSEPKPQQMIKPQTTERSLGSQVEQKLDGVNYVECENCKRSVPELRYIMHFRHCQKTVYHCDKCNSPVRIEEREKHDQEMHTQVPCEQCGEMLDAHQVQDHTNNQCLERIVFCQYCEFPMSAKDIGEHEQVCGVRTEICLKCNRYIPQKDLAEHDIYCTGVPEEIHYQTYDLSEYDCPFCQFPSLSRSQLVEHVKACHAGDTTPVVCPICAAGPNGDPTRVSADFHGHIDLRHSNNSQQ